MIKHPHDIEEIVIWEEVMGVGWVTGVYLTPARRSYYWRVRITSSVDVCSRKFRSQRLAERSLAEFLVDTLASRDKG